VRLLFHAALVLLCLAATLASPSTTRAADPVKVAVIVGPVGSLTPTYLALAEAAATAAERNGATVARAYSPNATPANVLAAVADANVIVYFGHGYGHPSPYGGLNTARQNGWALQGPRARGTHDDGLNGYLTYYGEDWIVANAKPAPGFVMIYSNTCYAPGASEGGFAPATAAVAAQRVAYYSRMVFTMGGSAYFATDFDRGAADLVDRLLVNRGMRYGDVFAADHRYVPGALTTQPHLFSAGQQIWLHRSRYTDGPPNYWYAFAGNPDATPMRSWDPVAPTVALERPAADAVDVAPWTEPKLRVSEAVRGLDASTVRLLDATGTPVAAEVHVNVETGAVRVDPEADLSLSARYTIEVGAGITDLAGNALEPRRWAFTTRLDADAWSAPEPVVLGQGEHRLVRLAADGTITDEQTVRVSTERRLVAASRARLPGASASWLELASGSLSGWWVAESPRAHVVGTVGEVRVPEFEVTLVAGAATTLDGTVLSTRDRVIAVDARAIVDGRPYLRSADEAATWFLAPSSATLDPVSENRILDRRKLAEPISLHLDAGSHTILRLDDAGRVTDRRTVTGGPDADPLTAAASAIVGGRSFHALSGDDLDGWVIGASERVTIGVAEDRDPT
jgi:hypothetical protein